MREVAATGAAGKSLRAPDAQTLAEKLIARAAGRTRVDAGEIVTCRVDLAMFHDSSGPRRLKPLLEDLGASIWNRDRVVLVMDHYVPERDDDARRIVRIARDWARDQALPHVYDSIGICHVVLPQRGHLRPGLFCVGGDSHSTTGGAFGSYMFGIGSTEMLGVLVTGEIWLRVPRTIRMHWDGRLQPGVHAKDMMLHMIGRFGMNGGRYQAVEYGGSAVRALDMQDRMTLTNMSAELGAQTGLIEADEVTHEWLARTGAAAPEQGLWCSDDEACDERHEFNADELGPQVAAPHSPSNVADVDRFGDVGIHVAYIGACTGAKLEDLAAAARVLRGRTIAAGVQLVVAPASVQDQAEAEARGWMAALRDAGAQVLSTGCGACAGYGGSIPDGATVISSTARNFRGRMGGEAVDVYLASPATVAASALRGRIADPREVLA
ncbi:aconitase/3-isopropylmalate dehydratase large subunit family protein [Variovorax sp. VNK109]|uniref:aconitase/3-isopropylmalate dehydratase large subunit family protein n=1 Tax=Variovorax sp. VNK109 TaxID=3400919 RepID=UPI003C018446